MESSKSVVSNSLIYTFSNVLLRAFNFFLLPLYTRFLTTEDYGVTSLATSFSSVAIYIIALSLYSAVYRFYTDVKHDAEATRCYFGTIFVFVCTSCVMFAGFCLIFSQFISSTFFVNTPFFPVVLAVVINTALSTVWTLYSDIIKSLQDAKRSSITTIVYFFVQLGLCLLFVVYKKEGALGVIKASTISHLIGVIWAMTDLRRRGLIQFCMKWEYLRDSLKYSIPILPHNLSAQLAQYISKLLIGSNYSVSTVGIFNLAQQFGSIADIVQTSVSTAFQPWFFEQMRKREIDQGGISNQIRVLTKYLVWCFCFIFMMLAMFSREAIIIMSAPAYHDAWRIVPLIIITYSIKIPYYFYINILYYHKEATKRIFWATLSTSVLNVLLSAALIPKYEMIGSIMADVVSMAARVAIIIIMTRKYSSESEFSLKMIAVRIILMLSIVMLALLPSYLIENFPLFLSLGIKLLAMIMLAAIFCWMERGTLTNVIKRFRMHR